MFRRKYTVRHFESGEIIDGYAHTYFNDERLMLNVQPLSSDTLEALPEGERRVKRLKAYGDEILTAADQRSGKRGDWLMYGGSWYECVSSLYYDHTILHHCKSEFVEVAAAETQPYMTEASCGGECML